MSTSKKYQRRLAELRVLNSRHEEAFRRGLAELERANDCEAVVARIAERVRAIVELPGRSWWEPLNVLPEASTLLAALGFASTSRGFVYAGSKAPSTLAELAVAAAALELFKPAQRSSDEHQGAGVATVVARRDATFQRRRFESSDTLHRVLAWLRVAFADDALSLDDLEATAPPHRIEPRDGQRTLQALGFWPGLELRLRSGSPATTPAPHSRPSNQKKPSEVFKSIADRFDDQGDARPKKTHFNIKSSRTNDAVPAPA